MALFLQDDWQSRMWGRKAMTQRGLETWSQGIWETEGQRDREAQGLGH